jgi:hypothetical protein
MVFMCREGSAARAVAASVVAFYSKHGDDLEYDDCDDLSVALRLALPGFPTGTSTPLKLPVPTMADSDSDSETPSPSRSSADSKSAAGVPNLSQAGTNQ